MNRVRLRHFGRVGVLALTLTFRLGLSSPPEAGATASGCGLWGNNRTPGWEGDDPDCGGAGGGCYLCSYHNTGQDGFTICSELPDGTGPCNGKACCEVVAQIPPDWPPPDPNDPPDPDPGAPPPDAPPPDSPGDGGGDGGGGGGGDCLPPECHEADLAPRFAATSTQRQPATNLWLSLVAVPFHQ